LAQIILPLVEVWQEVRARVSELSRQLLAAAAEIQIRIAMNRFSAIGRAEVEAVC
jgi:hypothetical protein